MPATETVQGAMTIPAGATTTQTGADITNPAARGVKVVVVSTVIGTGSITPTIQAKAPASGTQYTTLAAGTIVTNTTTAYTVYPGLTAAANVTVSDVLPQT